MHKAEENKTKLKCNCWRQIIISSCVQSCCRDVQQSLGRVSGVGVTLHYLTLSATHFLLAHGLPLNTDWISEFLWQHLINMIGLNNTCHTSPTAGYTHPPGGIVDQSVLQQRAEHEEHAGTRPHVHCLPVRRLCYVQGVCRQSAKAKLKNIHFTGGLPAAAAAAAPAPAAGTSTRATEDPRWY